MRIETVVLTPQKAQELLKRNTRNRVLSERRAKLLSDSMMRKEWVFNGDAIRVSESGVVLDGQHRLRAIVISGMQIKTLLIEGLPDSVFDTIDTGSSRTCGDVLSIQGIKNANVVAAALRLYFAWEKTGNPTHGSPESMPTRRQAEELISRKPNIVKKASEAAGTTWGKKYLTPSILTFCMLVFEDVDKDACGEFFAELETGGFSYAGSPVMRLRDRIMEDATNSKGTVNRGYKIALVFKAFKLYLKGESIKFLRVRTEGDAAEKDLYSL